MKRIHRLPSSDKFWIALFSCIVLVCVAIICFFQFARSSSVAVIYENGNEICRVDLSRVQESYTIPLSGNTILVEPGAISVQSASCPDKICMKQGKLHSVGRIVCLPNRVVIEMQSDKHEPDAKVG